MQKPLVKFAAYAIMILAILFALALILFAVLLFVLFPEGNMTKMTLTAIGLVILAVITALIGYAVFEAMNRVAEEENNHPNHPTLRPRPASVGTTERQANRPELRPNKSNHPNKVSEKRVISTSPPAGEAGRREEKSLAK